MRIVALDTSTPITSCALLEDGSRALGKGSCGRRPATCCVGAALGDLEGVQGVAVGLGPGSFTGLRIGLAAAKALSYARRLPLAGCSSLRALAEGEAGLACAATEARRNELFTQLFRDGALEGDVRVVLAADLALGEARLVRGTPKASVIARLCLPALREKPYDAAACFALAPRLPPRLRETGRIGAGFARDGWSANARNIGLTLAGFGGIQAGMTGFKVAIAGETGAVGREMIKVLEERDFPVAELVPLASERSEGPDADLPRPRPRDHGQAAHAGLLRGRADRPLLARRLRQPRVRAARRPGRLWWWIDNSSAFRMEADLPAGGAGGEPGRRRAGLGGRWRIIANPNCSTIQLVVVMKPLHDAAGLKTVIVSTYQSVSGAGQKGIDELEQQSRAVFNLAEISADKLPPSHRLQPDPRDRQGDSGNGYTEEEMKMVNESRKILGLPADGLRHLRAGAGLLLPSRRRPTSSSRSPSRANAAREILEEGARQA